MKGCSPITIAEALHVARDTRRLELGPGVLPQTSRVFREQFGDRPTVLIADTNTMAAAGQEVQRAFKATGQAVLEPFVFSDPALYAEHRFVEQLESSLRQHSAIPVAVGSGTINDLTKLAAHRTGRPYVCFATAASMDGYSAYGASITFQGSKQTFNCPAPEVVVADLEIIRTAPRMMSGWGYADLLAKVPAGADWILADALGEEAINALSWGIVQSRLRDAVADPAGVSRQDTKAIGHLVEGLILGGFAMQATQSSRPASGAEHQFSHLWDMQHHTHNGKAPSHGLKVGIGTLAVTALYECMLSEPMQELDVDAAVSKWVGQDVWLQRAHALFPADDLRAVAVKEVAAKYKPAEQIRQQLTELKSIWPSVVQALREQLLPCAVLKEMLSLAGAVTEPEGIGISRQRLRESFWLAFFIRRRFTILDVAVRTGLMDFWLDRIFGPAGLWPIKSQPQSQVH